MKDTLQALIDLQGIDTEIRGLRDERDALLGQIDRLAAVLDQGRAELQHRRDQLESAEKFYRDKNEDLRDSQEKAARAKSKLTQITKNAEYLAAQREIEAMKKANGQREEEVLKLLEAIEDYRTSIAEEEKKLEVLEAELAERRAGSAERIAALDAGISSVDGRRAELGVTLTDKVVRKYVRIAKARDGQAVVAVIDGVCSGCNLQIPPQQYNLLMRADKLDHCPTCQRFIFAGSVFGVGVGGGDAGEGDEGDGE